MRFLNAAILKLDRLLFEESPDSANLGRGVWHKKPLSVALLYVCVSVVAYWNWPSPSPIPPGYAVTALAVAASVMTVLGEMKGKEKLAWIGVLFAFLVLELRSIDVERKNQNDLQRAAHAEQTANFKTIGNGIQASIEKGQTNFQTTMRRTNQVLENITGGDSFAYVAPQNFAADEFPGILWNNGEQALTGLTLTIAHTSEPVEVWGAAFFKPIFIGTVGPHDHAPIPDFVFRPRADPKTGQDNYWIMLSAQNGTAQQSIWFRRNRLHPQLWAYSFQVVREHYAEKPQREKMLLKIDSTPRKGPRQQLLLFRAWSDDMEAALQKH